VIGRTLYDLARVDQATGRVTIGKVLTTRRDPGDAILAGLAERWQRHGQRFADLAHMVCHYAGRPPR
jgi:hypothetical protein